MPRPAPRTRTRTRTRTRRILTRRIRIRPGQREPHERAGAQVELRGVQPRQGQRLTVVDPQFEVDQGDHEPGQAGEVVRAGRDADHPPHRPRGIDHEIEVEHRPIDRAGGCRHVAGEHRRLVADADQSGATRNGELDPRAVHHAESPHDAREAGERRILGDRGHADAPVRWRGGVYRRRVDRRANRPTRNRPTPSRPTRRRRRSPAFHPGRSSTASPGSRRTAAAARRSPSPHPRTPFQGNSVLEQAADRHPGASGAQFP